MAVNAAYSPISSPGAGTAAPIPITWPFIAEAHLTVVEIVDATLVETARTLGVHYTVTQSTDGGTVTPLSSIAVGRTWRITRDTPLTQPDSLRLGGSFSEHTVEKMFDRLTMIAQEQDARIAALEA